MSDMVWHVQDFGTGGKREIKLVDQGDGTYAIKTDTALSLEGLTIDSVGITSIAAGDNNIGNVDVVSLPALPAGENAIGSVIVTEMPEVSVTVDNVSISSIAAGSNNIGDVDVVSLPAIPAGTNLIGKVGIDQTTPGTTNGVQVNAALPAGTNNIGDVDVLSLPTLPAGDNNIGNVDVVTLPTLPAGDNNIGNVDLASAIPAGGNVIGKVGIDQTTPGTTNGVQVNAALPAGDNNIGNVDIVTLPALPAGSNNIGDVDVLTLPALPAGSNNIGDVDVLTLPALPTGNNTIGKVEVTVVPALVAGTANIGDVDVASIAAGDNTIGRVKITDGTDLALVDGSGNQMVALGTSLPAGTAAIGKLAANAGVNIGDTSLTTRTLTTVTGTAASSGDNALVSAPGASTRIVVVHFTIQNESTTATTMILRTATTNKRRVLAQNQGDGLSVTFNRGDEWRLGTNEALNLNLSGANSCGYTVDYFTEAV